MRKKFENEELVKCILRNLNKSNEDDFCEEDLMTIESIGFDYLKNNGDKTGIEIKDLVCFPNLKSVTLRNYELTNKDIQIISILGVENVAFDNCILGDIDFDKIEDLPENLRFIRCRQMPKKYPKVKNVMIDSCIVDFESIDFGFAKRLNILSSKIYGAHDIDQFDSIEEAIFDGSEFFTKKEEKIDDIKVSLKTQYSHEEIDKHFVDDRKEEIVRDKNTNDNGQVIELA